MRTSFDPKWETIHSEREWGQYPAEHVIRFVARNFYKVPDRSAIKILDYGAGGGVHTLYLAREGFDTYAFDGAAAAVKRIRDRMQRENLRADVQVSDALNTPYPDEFFDAVIDNFCITANATGDVKNMYREIYRVLKHGGKLLTGLFGRRTDGYRTGVRLDDNTWDRISNRHLHDVGKIFFTDEADISMLLKDAGFGGVEVDTITYTDDGDRLEQLIVKAVKPS